MQAALAGPAPAEPCPQVGPGQEWLDHGLRGIGQIGFVTQDLAAMLPSDWGPLRSSRDGFDTPLGPFPSGAQGARLNRIGAVARNDPPSGGGRLTDTIVPLTTPLRSGLPDERAVAWLVTRPEASTVKVTRTTPCAPEECAVSG